MKASWRIAPPLALATTLHAMVLTGVVQWRGSTAGGEATLAPSHVASLSVRVTPQPERPQEPPVTATAPAAASSLETSTALDNPQPLTEAPASAHVSAPAEASPLREASAPPPVVSPHALAPTQPADLVPPAQPVATDTVSQSPAAAVATSEPGLDADRYHARRELSRPPKALTPIDIVFPPGVPTPGRHAAVLAVYIDEFGNVRKVRTEGEALPQAFEDAARNAFLSAKFRAGELGGQAVKAYIHVEVVFDEMPEARGLAASGLGRTSH